MKYHPNFTFASVAWSPPAASQHQGLLAKDRNRGNERHLSQMQLPSLFYGFRLLNLTDLASQVTFAQGTSQIFATVVLL